MPMLASLLPAEHWRRGVAAGELGLCRRELGEAAASERLIATALENLDRSRGEGHPLTRSLRAAAGAS